MGFCDHSLILKNDGTLWSTGYNQYGQLGLGDNIDKTTFTEVTTNTDNIKSVCYGGTHAFILKNDNTLWGCGRNDYGQLGLGDTSHRYTFTEITNNVDDIKSVCCGYSHTFILKNDGTLWECGWNTSGQLGLGDTTNRYTFTQITTNADDVKSIHGGYEHTFILENDGTLWGCGRNDYGQLGLGDTTNRNTFTQIVTNTDDIKSVYCSYDHVFILKNDGTLWSTGYNSYGQLGLGDTTDRTTFTQITTNTDNIKSVYCGNKYSFILKNDGTLWSTGYNDDGRLGLGDSTNRNTFTQVTTNTDNIKEIYCAG